MDRVVGLPAPTSAMEQPISCQAAAKAPVPAFFRLPRSHLPTIGILAPCYGMERVSYLISSKRRNYVTLHRIPIHRWERRGTFLQQTPLIVGPGVDLIHTFNQLPLNRRFVVSVEMELPRYLGRTHSWQTSFGMRLLDSDRCRGIWPLSEAARRYLLRRFEANGFKHLGEKLLVFRGAVPASAREVSIEPDQSGPLKLLFVGTDGLRKGLRPTLEVVSKLRRQGMDIRLTVIGKPQSETYIVPGATFPTTDLLQVLAEQDGILHHPSLPNSAVRRLMDSHDILLFPTMDESLGWVIAEAAASGLPTIATNIFAIPELVLDGVSGWLIKLNLDQDGRWEYIGRSDARDAWVAAQQSIAAQLEGHLIQAYENRSLVGKFGMQAREHIVRWYSPTVAEGHLSALYAAAMDKMLPA